MAFHSMFSLSMQVLSYYQYIQKIIASLIHDYDFTAFYAYWNLQVTKRLSHTVMNLYSQELKKSLGSEISQFIIRLSNIRTFRIIQVNHVTCNKYIGLRMPGLSLVSVISD